MTYQLVNIAPDQMKGVYPLVKEWIKKAVDSSRGRNTAYGLIQNIMQDQWQIWIIWNDEVKECRGIVLTTMYKTSSDMQICAINVVVGRNRKEWIHLLDSLELWAKDQGCEVIETWARPGWEKILSDYKRTHVLLEKRLDDVGIGSGKNHDGRDGYVEEQAATSSGISAEGL